MPEPFDLGARSRPHLRIELFQQTARKAVRNIPRDRPALRADYRAHADALMQQLAAALGNIPIQGQDSRLPIEGLKLGTNIALTTLAPSDDSTSIRKFPQDFDFASKKIAVLRTERAGDRTERAVVFVPDEAREFLVDRLDNYGSPGNGRRTDLKRFEVVEKIEPASAASLFSGTVDLTSTDPCWWELWVSQVTP